MELSISNEEYKTMRDILLENCNEISENQIKKLLLHYELEINSRRRLENIKNINELLIILEKRDCLSNKNPIILCQIAGFLNLPAIFNQIQKNEDRSFVQKDKSVKNSNIPESNSDDDILKRKIRKKISEELGKSWIDFARALDVRECQIDELKMKKHSLRSCAEYILDFHENESHPRVWQSRLLQALRKARRNDLSNAVQDIIDNYS